jgi:hypothetical protein
MEDFIGRRRNWYGQSTEKDDPGRQRMRIGSVVTGLSIVMARCDAGMPILMVVVVMVVVMIAVMVIVAAPSVGHGGSAEKRQCRCHNDNRFKDFGHHVVSSLGSRIVSVGSAAVLSVWDDFNLARGFGRKDVRGLQKVYKLLCLALQSRPCYRISN